MASSLYLAVVKRLKDRGVPASENWQRQPRGLDQPRVAHQRTAQDCLASYRGMASLRMPESERSCNRQGSPAPLPSAHSDPWGREPAGTPQHPPTARGALRGISRRSWPCRPLNEDRALRPPIPKLGPPAAGGVRSEGPARASKTRTEHCDNILRLARITHLHIAIVTFPYLFHNLLNYARAVGTGRRMLLDSPTRPCRLRANRSEAKEPISS